MCQRIPSPRRKDCFHAQEGGNGLQACWEAAHDRAPPCLFLRGTQYQASPAFIHPGGLVSGQDLMIKLGQSLALPEVGTAHSQLTCSYCFS